MFRITVPIFVVIMIACASVRAQRLPVRPAPPPPPPPTPWEQAVSYLNKHLVVEGNEECWRKAKTLLEDYNARKHVGRYPLPSQIRDYEEWQNKVRERAEVAKKMIWVARTFFKHLDQIVSAEEKGQVNNSFEVFRRDEFRKPCPTCLPKSYVEEAIEKASKEVSVRTYYYGRTVRQGEDLNYPMIIRDSFQQLLRIAPKNSDVKAFYRGERNQVTPFIQVRMNGTDYSYEVLPFRSNHELMQVGIELLHDENLYSPNSTYFDKARRELMEKIIMLSALGELEFFSSTPVFDYVKSPISPSLWVHRMIGDSCFGPRSSRIITQEMLDSMKPDDKPDTEEVNLYESVLKIKPIELAGHRQVPARILDVERITFLNEILGNLRKEMGPTPEVINPSARPAPIRIPAPPPQLQEGSETPAAEVLVPKSKGSQ